MLNAIRHGLGNLFNGNGRDARQAFWYYVLFLYIVTTAISAAVSMPAAMEAFFSGMQQAVSQGGRGDPAAQQAAMEVAMIGSMARMFPAMMWVSLAVGAILLAGLAASFVRRLHDSGLSGWWALLPGGCQVISMATVPSQMARMQQQMQEMDLTNPLAGLSMMRGAFGAGPLLAWVAIGIVVALGVRKSTPGANRFGEAPYVA